MPLLPMVGRTGFEPVTNGLKGRYALIARTASPLCNVRRHRRKSSIPPASCQILPTIGASEYRSTRPVTEPLSHAGSGHFHRYNIQASRPSFGAALRLVIPTTRGLK